MSEWIDKIRISDNDEIKLWAECIFIFDSSALLNFYEYPLTTQMDIFERIFNNLNGRLWVPNHVKYEYLKNRKEALKKPASQYKDLLNITFRNMKNLFVEIKNKTKTGERHPVLDQTIFAELESSIENFEKSFVKNVQEKIDAVNEYEMKDFVLEKFQKLIKVGEDYKYDKLSEIAREGEFRYRHRIPPGYLDEDGKGKAGFQTYGDLIIWKQIIDFARQSNKPIVFINDDKKEDWWVKSGKEVVAPRDELVREIKDLGGVNFWMYTSGDFLEKANKLLKAELDKETINDVNDALISTLEESDWEVLLNRKDIIHLNGYQFAPCSHSNLKHVVSILWNYRDYKLTLTPISNPEMDIERRNAFDLRNYSYILLNPNIEPQRWLYRILIKNEKIELELLTGPRTQIEIIDQQ